MHAIEEDGILKPFTRDTFSFAIKAVYAEFEDKDGNITKMPVFKDPITDRGAGNGFKKSQKGCCRVYNENGKIKFVDNLNWLESMQGTLMKTVFKNGKMVKEESLNDIRQRLNDNQF